MNNDEIAGVFREIADLLEKKKDNWFKIRAYRKAADSVEGLSEPVGQLVKEGKLKKVPGVGEAITKKITELLTTGRLEYYDRLRGEFSEGAE